MIWFWMAKIDVNIQQILLLISFSLSICFMSLVVLFFCFLFLGSKQKFTQPFLRDASIFYWIVTF